MIPEDNDRHVADDQESDDQQVHDDQQVDSENDNQKVADDLASDDEQVQVLDGENSTNKCTNDLVTQQELGDEKKSGKSTFLKTISHHQGFGDCNRNLFCMVRSQVLNELHEMLE